MLKKPSANKRRSRRLEKKLHVGHFRSFGFNLKITFKPEISSIEKEKFFYKFIDECIEKYGFIIGGTCERSFITSKYITCLEFDRARVSEYLSIFENILSFNVFPLVDAWYGPFED